MQAWDRYAAMANNPVNMIDPSGHRNCEEDGYCPDAGVENDPPPSQKTLPPITYNEERGLCINIGNIGCSGGTNYRDWYANEYIPMWPTYAHSDLTELSTITQDAATATSTIGAGMELGGLAIGGLPGALAGNTLHQSSTNKVETVLSWSPTGFTLIDSVFVTHETHFDASGNLIVDEKTATSFAGTVAGTVVPIAILDAIIDGYVSSYNHDFAPGINNLFQTFLK